MSWIRDWIKMIDPEKLTPLPLQFANVDRIEANNEVYIFDEVGSGKTIGSGLMAAAYLNNSNRNVLIVTTNSTKHQFGSDWENKLPLDVFFREGRINIVNNHNASFDNMPRSAADTYGLVIIDEAQLFLNHEQKRFTSLIGKVRKAEKVVFLTATPIKNDIDDLYKYCCMAMELQGKVEYTEVFDFKKYTKHDEWKKRTGWIDRICCCKDDPMELICSRFDVLSPVTRYFKDTTDSLNIENKPETQRKRTRISEVWKWSGGTRQECLVNNIIKRIETEPDSRFVVFTRLVDAEALLIEKCLSEKGFKPYTLECSDEESTYAIITGTGGNVGELEYYKGRSNLPRVLVLTYQIAEQGVNLPGFNYVINYHISKFPSSLEQRFGRIDRIVSKYEKIHICFLISDSRINWWDTNTFNYYSAVCSYINALIPALPARNTVLTPEMILSANQINDRIKDYVRSVRDMLTEEKLEYVINNYPGNDIGDPVYDILNDPDSGVELPDTCFSPDERVKQLKDDICSYLDRLNGEIGSLSKSDCEKYIRIIEKTSDNIFWCNSSGELMTVSPYDCADHIKGGVYKDFYCRFRKEIDIPLKLQSVKEIINIYFESCFYDNNFNHIFPLTGYRRLLEEIRSLWEIKDPQTDGFVLENADKIVASLPIFKMFDQFGTKLLECGLRSPKAYGGLYEGEWCYEMTRSYEYNPFVFALTELGSWILRSDDLKGLSETFADKYWKRVSRGICLHYKQYFCFEKDENGIIKASNWYKLAYRYLRGEKKMVYYESEFDIGKNVYYVNWYEVPREKVEPLDIFQQDIWEISRMFQEVGNDEKQFYRIRYEDKITYYDEKTRPRRDIHCKSWLKYFVYTPNDNKRANIPEEMIPPDTYRYYTNDIWTQGIIYELNGTIFKTKWGDVLSLPSDYADIQIFIS